MLFYALLVLLWKTAKFGIDFMKKMHLATMVEIYHHFTVKIVMSGLSGSIVTRVFILLQLFLVKLEMEDMLYK